MIGPAARRQLSSRARSAASIRRAHSRTACRSNGVDGDGPRAASGAPIEPNMIHVRPRRSALPPHAARRPRRHAPPSPRRPRRRSAIVSAAAPMPGRGRRRRRALGDQPEPPGPRTPLLTSSPPDAGRRHSPTSPELLRRCPAWSMALSPPVESVPGGSEGKELDARVWYAWLPAGEGPSRAHASRRLLSRAGGGSPLVNPNE